MTRKAGKKAKRFISRKVYEDAIKPGKKYNTARVLMLGKVKLWIERVG